MEPQDLKRNKNLSTIAAQKNNIVQSDVFAK